MGLFDRFSSQSENVESSVSKKPSKSNREKIRLDQVDPRPLSNLMDTGYGGVYICLQDGCNFRSMNASEAKKHRKDTGHSEEWVKRLKPPHNWKDPVLSL